MPNQKHLSSAEYLDPDLCMVFLPTRRLVHPAKARFPSTSILRPLQDGRGALNFGCKDGGATTMAGVQLLMTLWQLLKKANAMLHTSFRGRQWCHTFASIVKAPEIEVCVCVCSPEHAGPLSYCVTGPDIPPSLLRSNLG
jgi:hypothetical protein